MIFLFQNKSPFQSIYLFGKLWTNMVDNWQILRSDDRVRSHRNPNQCHTTCTSFGEISHAWVKGLKMALVKSVNSITQTAYVSRFQIAISIHLFIWKIGYAACSYPQVYKGVLHLHRDQSRWKNSSEFLWFVWLRLKWYF